MLSIGGDNLQFYFNFALFSTLGGMNLDQDFFQVSKLSEERKKNEHFFPRIQVKTKKKSLHQQWNTFFSPKSSGDLRSDAYQGVKLLEGIQMKTILKLLGGYSQIIWGIYPPIPPGFLHPLS